MQVAAALSMGMDPASAIAAAAAAAAGGFPSSDATITSTSSTTAYTWTWSSNRHTSATSSPPPAAAAVPSIGMHLPAQQYPQYDNNIPPQSSEESESIDTSSTRAGLGTGDSEPSYTSTPVKRGSKGADGRSRHGQHPDESFQYGYLGEQQNDDENLINSMNKMKLNSDNGSKAYDSQT